MEGKVYCVNCMCLDGWHNPITDEFGRMCKHPENIAFEDTWHSRERTYLLPPEVRNKQNNCPLFVSFPKEDPK